MKSCSVGLDAHSRQGQTTLARLLQVTRIPDGQIFAFTNHDQDIVVGGVTYKASTSFNPFNANAKSDGTAKNSECTGAFDLIITRADVLAGLWDGANLQLLLCNWGNISQGTGILVTGTFGPWEAQDFGWKTTLRGLAYRLTAIGGDLSGPTCRATFGDSKCAPGGLLADGTDINTLLQAGTVSSTPDGYRTILVSGISDIGKPRVGGLVIFTSGANQNLSAEIMSITYGVGSPVSPTTITLRPWIPIAVVSPGDGFSVFPGCDKVRTTCDFVYLNILNNQSEPDAPDPDATIQYPDYIAPGSAPQNGRSGAIPLG